MPWTAEQYRKIANGADGPWPGEARKPFVSGDLTTGNYYADRGMAWRGICLHITVSRDDFTPPDTSGQAVSNYFDTRRDASTTAIVDQDSIHPYLQDHRVPFAQGVSGYSFNKPLGSLEICKWETDWRDDPPAQVENLLRMAAVWCAPRVIAYDIPMVLMRDRAEIARRISAGQMVGFCYHADLDPVNRTDPGIVATSTGRVDTFPWLRFLVMLREEVALRTAPTKPGHEATLWVQTVLDAMGYPLGSWGVDGAYGPTTQAALDTYRADHGVTATGYPTLDEITAMEVTLSLLTDQLAEQGRQLAALTTQVTELRGTVLAEKGFATDRHLRVRADLTELGDRTNAVLADTAALRRARPLTRTETYEMGSV